MTCPRIAEKVACARGHLFAGDNLGHDRRGNRYCKACAALRQRACHARRQKERSIA